MPIKDGRRHVRIRSLKIDVDAGVKSWQSIDVKQVLVVWLRQPETNWGIEIKAFDSESNDLAITSAEPGEEGLVSGLKKDSNMASIKCLFMCAVTRNGLFKQKAVNGN